MLIYLFTKIRAMRMFNAIAAEHADDFIDKDDPEFANVNIRRFYVHHPLEAMYIEVDGAAIEGM